MQSFYQTKQCASGTVWAVVRSDAAEPAVLRPMKAVGAVEKLQEVLERAAAAVAGGAELALGVQEVEETLVPAAIFFFAHLGQQ